MAGLLAKMYARFDGVSARAVALLLMSVVVANCALSETHGAVLPAAKVMESTVTALKVAFAAVVPPMGPGALMTDRRVLGLMYLLATGLLVTWASAALAAGTARLAHGWVPVTLRVFTLMVSLFSTEK
jgi:hypothetical protein